MEAVAKLRNNPTSTRKMRLLADLIRGMDVEKALSILKYHPKHPSVPLEKLLVSAISNWKQKNETDRVEDAGLYVKTIFVDGGRTLKRMRPAPQGRGYRVRKRSNHVTIIVDGRVALPAAEPVKEEKTVAEKAPVEKAPAKARAPKAKPEAKSGEAKPAAKKKAATKKS